jgi:DNA-binding beta-propeller fold protein YncE
MKTRLRLKTVLTVLCLAGATAPALANADRLNCGGPKVALPAASATLDTISNEELKKRAESDSGPGGRLAARVLAERYENGVSTPANPQQAAAYYEMAAFIAPQPYAVYLPGFGGVPGSTVMVDGNGPVTPGDVIAMSRLAQMYRDGVGVERSAARAERLSACVAKLAPAEFPAPKTPAPVASPPPATPVPVTAFVPLPEPAFRAKYSSTPVPTADSALLDRTIATFSVSSDVTGLAWSPDGRYLAVTGYAGTIELLDSKNGRRIWKREQSFVTSSPETRVLEFSPDGSLLYISSASNTVDREGGREEVLYALFAKNGQVANLFRYEAPQQGSSTARALALDHQRLITVSWGHSNRVIAYDANGKASTTLELPRILQELTQSFASSRLAIDRARDRLWWAHGGMLQPIRLSDGVPSKEIQAFNYRVTAMRINPKTGEVIVGGTGDVSNSRYPMSGPLQEYRTYRDDPVTLVRAIDPEGKAPARIYLGPGSSVSGLAVNPQGTMIAATKGRWIGASNSYVLLWDAASQKLLSSKDFGQASVGDVAFDPEGKRLAYAAGRRIYITKIDPAP